MDRVYSAISPVSSSVLDHFIPFGGHWEVLELIPAANGRRHRTPLKEPPARPGPCGSTWGFGALPNGTLPVPLLPQIP